MNDPDAPEQYCSAYYDKHGSYNDGFPCPNDKYCCQNKDGGLKFCCSLTSINKNRQQLLSSLAPSSTTVSKINNEFILSGSQPKLNSHKSFGDGDSSTLNLNSQSASAASLPILLTK